MGGGARQRVPTRTLYQRHTGTQAHPLSTSLGCCINVTATYAPLSVPTPLSMPTPTYAPTTSRNQRLACSNW
jgi:hypothetical protein